MTIPDRFTIGGALLGLFLSYLYPSIQFVDGVASSSRFEAFGHSLGGMLIGSSILYWIGVMAHGIFGREALGEGDVKLLGCIGAFCGWKGAIFAIFGGAMIGSFLLLPIIIFSRLGWKKTKDEKSRLGERGTLWSISGNCRFIVLAWCKTLDGGMVFRETEPCSQFPRV